MLNDNARYAHFSVVHSCPLGFAVDFCASDTDAIHRVFLSGGRSTAVGMQQRRRRRRPRRRRRGEPPMRLMWKALLPGSVPECLSCFRSQQSCSCFQLQWLTGLRRSELPRCRFSTFSYDRFSSAPWRGKQGASCYPYRQTRRPPSRPGGRHRGARGGLRNAAFLKGTIRGPSVAFKGASPDRAAGAALERGWRARFLTFRW